ncbi:hypothetical protein CRV08_01545 [Halarcobacter ebronensis]|uniref:Response regulator n=1 Tax=Halarcobacter ebronensis TaxID=1462615 RepID=A0A4Q0YK18_9BACT|nr:hybrid sensor histidine kinase/response regulator [Halarcobacter ebronensis]RXJ70274.1 hypothetical protein CRV08_01545 [Halarcobacter ebronensis]
MDLSNQNNLNLNIAILNQSNILYAEDDVATKDELLPVLEHYFNKVFIACDGNEALKLYSANKNEIDIILTDVNMPNVSGIDFIKEVRKEDFELPILIITTFNDSDFLLKIIKLNISDYIAKPILVNTTIKIMNRILTNRYNQKLVFKQKKELQLYRDVLDQENLISETDLNGTIIYVNDIFCEVSGYSKEELIGSNHNIIRHPDTSPKIFESLWGTIQNKEVWRGKLKNRAKNGNDYYVKATIFPVLDEDGNIEKYVSSRYLITEDEEEKHKLKKYILQQKTHQIKHQKRLQEEFDDALHYAKMEKDKQVAKFFTGLNDQIKTLKTKNADDKGRILSLEKHLRTSMDKNDDMQKNYQERIEKLYSTATSATNEYQKIKKKYEVINEKFEKSQEGIKVLQGYIDEYREKIKNLEEVIEEYEKGKAQLTTTK